MNGLTYATFPAQFLLYIPTRSSTKDPYSGFILMNATKMPAAGHFLEYIRLAPVPAGAPTHEFDKNPFETLYYPGISRYLGFKGDDSDSGLESPVSHSVRPWSIPVRNVVTGAQVPVIEIQKVNRCFVKMLRRNVLLRVSAAAPAPAHVSADPLGALMGVFASVASTPISSPPILTTPTTPSTSVIAHVPVTPKPIKKKKPVPAPVAASHPLTGDLCLHVARQLLELAQIKKEMCPVIAEEYTAGETAAMPCGHLFSKLAIQETFKKEHNKCPACRQAGRPTFV